MGGSMIIRATLAAAAVAVVASAAQAEQWFCEANDVVGFIYEPTEARWSNTTFSGTPDRYIISTVEDERHVAEGLCCTKPLMSEVPLSLDGFIPRLL